MSGGGAGSAGGGRFVPPPCVTAKISTISTTPPTPAMIGSGFVGADAPGRRGAGTIGMDPVPPLRGGDCAGILPEGLRFGAGASSSSGNGLHLVQ